MRYPRNCLSRCQIPINEVTYIQSAYAMPTEEKAEVELRPFTLTGDSFPKIVVRKDIGKRWYDDMVQLLRLL